jgi:hypothetical protein
LWKTDDSAGPAGRARIRAHHRKPGYGFAAIDARVADVLNSKVARMAKALDDQALRPVADPTIVPGDPVADVIGDIDALRELLAIQQIKRWPVDDEADPTST